MQCWVKQWHSQGWTDQGVPSQFDLIVGPPEAHGFCVHWLYYTAEQQKQQIIVGASEPREECSSPAKRLRVSTVTQNSHSLPIIGGAP